MSNQQVGMVYDRVIQEVCEASQVDFEEGGVDQQTLEEMRTSWQQKLSLLAVAHFPWDPPLQPTPPPAPPQNPILPPTATVPSNAPRPTPPPIQQQGPPQHPPQSLPGAGPSPTQTPNSSQVPVSASPPNPNGQSPHIKTEQGINGLPTVSTMPPAQSNAQALARERAMNNLNSKYGAAAANSVSQLQAQSQAALSLPGQQRAQNIQTPNGQPQDIKPLPAYPNVSQPQRAPFSSAQTDGADEAHLEWKAEVARRREVAQRQNGEGDMLLLEQLRLQALRLEAGGLMRPLEEHLPSKVAKYQAGLSTANPSVPPAPYDGADDDDKLEDEDAINSDLDDPDDLVAEEHDSEDAVGQVMLCTYDKVQRVKNKWKCTLKDGILSTGGKEYVFHKGQGEFEW